MKHKTYIAVLLAGMLALAGCGGSSSTPPTDPPEKTPLEIAQERIEELEGNDNRSEAEKLAENTRICEAGGGKYANGACTPDTTKADNDARIATAKALEAAIGIDGVDPGVTTASIPAFDLDGSGSGNGRSIEINLKKATGTVAALGGWAGADYEGMEGTGAAKHTGMVRSYSNAEAAKKVAFVGSAGEAIHGLMDGSSDNKKDDYTVPAAVADRNIAGSAFPTTGTETYAGNDRKFAGTYMGASGTYECTSSGDDACQASARGDDRILLTGAWTFTPSAGAMLDMTDARYLQFGWWVRKDNDGDPTHAGAFYGSTGSSTLDPFSTVNNDNLVGKATYMGKAAGKFAVSDGLRPADDHSGHFTADARLEADFKSAGSTLSGTISNFRLNDDGTTDPGWSVELQKAMWDGNNDSFKTSATPANDRTVWSIGTAKGTAAGTWEAQLYDDKADGGSNNTPQSVAGKFHSAISTTHEMVGAFGAELQSN